MSIYKTILGAGVYIDPVFDVSMARAGLINGHMCNYEKSSVLYSLFGPTSADTIYVPADGLYTSFSQDLGSMYDETVKYAEKSKYKLIQRTSDALQTQIVVYASAAYDALREDKNRIGMFVDTFDDSRNISDLYTKHIVIYSDTIPIVKLDEICKLGHYYEINTSVSMDKHFTIQILKENGVKNKLIGFDINDKILKFNCQSILKEYFDKMFEIIESD